MGNTTISLPTEFFINVHDMLEEHPEFGYVSVTEFIKDSIRRNLERCTRLRADIQYIKEHKD